MIIRLIGGHLSVGAVDPHSVELKLDALDGSQHRVSLDDEDVDRLCRFAAALIDWRYRRSRGEGPPAEYDRDITDRHPSREAAPRHAPTLTQGDASR